MLSIWDGADVLPDCLLRALRFSHPFIKQHLSNGHLWGHYSCLQEAQRNIYFSSHFSWESKTWLILLGLHGPVSPWLFHLHDAIRSWPSCQSWTRFKVSDLGREIRPKGKKLLMTHVLNIPPSHSIPISGDKWEDITINKQTFWTHIPYFMGDTGYSSKPSKTVSRLFRNKCVYFLPI